MKQLLARYNEYQADTRALKEKYRFMIWGTHLGLLIGFGAAVLLSGKHKEN